MPVDLTTAATQPFAPHPVHRAFAAFVGQWSGTTFTWLDPSGEPQTSELDAEGELLLGGRFLQIRYAGRLGEKDHAGLFLVGFHLQDERVEASWVDSFHTGTQNMPCVGPAPDGGPLRFMGTYPAGEGEPRWGWRTALMIDPEGVLILDAENVHPDGQEDRAMAWRLRRVA